VNVAIALLIFILVILHIVHTKKNAEQIFHQFTFVILKSLMEITLSEYVIYTGCLIYVTFFFTGQLAPTSRKSINDWCLIIDNYMKSHALWCNQ
jgi:hypothetical protein